jgi:hypothetical protein
MGTQHKIIFGNCMSMEEIPNESVHLAIIEISIKINQFKAFGWENSDIGMLKKGGI